MAQVSTGIVLIALLAASPFVAPAVAQGQPAAPADTQIPASSPSPNDAPAGQTQVREEQALRVFLDCGPCDFDYLRREITFVNYVRDRKDAQVHVLVTTRPTGGGQEWTLNFIGLEEFAGNDVAHRYNTSQTDTPDERREGLAQVLRVGFVHYVIDTPAASQIEIRQNGQSRERRGQTSMARPEDDPWNFWVYRAGVNVNTNGEESRSNFNVGGNVSANRVTEDWKIRLNTNGQYSDRTFELSSGRTAEDIQSNFGLNAQVVRSMGANLGVSMKANASASTFVNQDLTFSVSPGIEYNFFPYDESSRRLLTVTYEVGASRFNYREVTLFDRLSERLYDQAVLVRFDVRQPWGDSGLGFDFSHYLHDRSKFRMQVRGDIEYRITRGLGLNMGGDVSMIRDQLFLPREDLTDEEILLQRRQLATSYRYFFRIGVNYTFGSIFNNIVNPRFADGERGGGGRFR